MLLPTPNAEEVEKFQQLHEANFGERLEHEKAYNLATALIRLVYLVDNPDISIEKEVLLSKPPLPLVFQQTTPLIPIPEPKVSKNKKPRFRPEDRLIRIREESEGI